MSPYCAVATPPTTMSYWQRPRRGSTTGPLADVQSVEVRVRSPQWPRGKGGIVKAACEEPGQAGTTRLTAAHAPARAESVAWLLRALASAQCAFCERASELKRSKPHECPLFARVGVRSLAKSLDSACKFLQCAALFRCTTCNEHNALREVLCPHSHQTLAALNVWTDRRPARARGLACRIGERAFDDALAVAPSSFFRGSHEATLHAGASTLPLPVTTEM